MLWATLGLSWGKAEMLTHGPKKIQKNKKNKAVGVKHHKGESRLCCPDRLLLFADGWVWKKKLKTYASAFSSPSFLGPPSSPCEEGIFLALPQCELYLLRPVTVQLPGHKSLNLIIGCILAMTFPLAQNHSL